MYIKCCFQNYVNVREDEKGRRWTTFGFENEKKFNSCYYTVFINVPCSEFFIFFPCFNLILPQKNNINAVMYRQLNIKILKKSLFNAIKE